MWDCEGCGCKSIAHDLGFCPQCFKPREEAEVPKTTVAGGPSNAYEDQPGQEQDAAAVNAAAEPAKARSGAAESGSASDSVQVERKAAPKDTKE